MDHELQSKANGLSSNEVIGTIDIAPLEMLIAYWNADIKEVVVVHDQVVSDGQECIDHEWEVVAVYTTVGQLLTSRFCI